MNREESGNYERDLKREVAAMMVSFETAMESYSSNRRQLDSLLSHLIKAYRAYKIHKPGGRVGKQSSRQDIYFEFLLLNNIACCYHTKKETAKACEYAKLADRQLRQVLEQVQKGDLDYETRKLESIAIQLRMVRVKLQLCGMYALNIQHMESLNESSQAFTLLQTVISSVCDYAMGEKFNEAFLELQRSVTEPNTEITEKEIKNSYWNNIMNCQSDEQVRSIFLALFKNYHSKQQTQARSCLGKIISGRQDKADTVSPESKKYLKEFTIGSVMKVTPLSLEDFDINVRKEDYVHLRFLHQLTILLSLTHFTVSTELRLSSASDLEPTGLESLEEDMNLVKRQKRMIEAERHHFFAIETIYKMATPYVKDCPFFFRLIKGYEEVYLLKDNFEIIPEKVEEQNETSLISVINKKASKYDYREHEDYYLKKMKESKCQTPRSQAKKQLRAELIHSRKKEQDKMRNTRKTPSTNKSSNNFLSPRLPPRHPSKSREKEPRGMKSRTILQKGLLPSTGLRKSRNEVKSPHRDYKSYHH